MTTMTRNATTPSAFGIEIAALVYHTVQAVQDQIAIRRTVRALRGASDTALRDMGIARDDIKTVAREIVRGR